MCWDFIVSFADSGMLKAAGLELIVCIFLILFNDVTLVAWNQPGSIHIPENSKVNKSEFLFHTHLTPANP